MFKYIYFVLLALIFLSPQQILAEDTKTKTLYLDEQIKELIQEKEYEKAIDFAQVGYDRSVNAYNNLPDMTEWCVGSDSECDYYNATGKSYFGNIIAMWANRLAVALYKAGKTEKALCYSMKAVKMSNITSQFQYENNLDIIKKGK